MSGEAPGGSCSATTRGCVRRSTQQGCHARELREPPCISLSSRRRGKVGLAVADGRPSPPSGTGLTLDTLCFGFISAKERASRGGGDQACGLAPRFERRRRRGRDGNHLFDLYH